jgi:hypothetical protein
MNIQEKLNYFTQNMNTKFAEVNLIKMMQMMKDLKRYVSREIQGNRNLIFSSQDLRSFAICLNKLLKKLHRDVEFDRFRTKLESRKVLTNSVWIEECQLIQKKLNLAVNLQPVVLEANYYAVVVDILERMAQQEKEASDEIFNHEILAGLLEVY